MLSIGTDWVTKIHAFLAENILASSIVFFLTILLAQYTSLDCNFILCYENLSLVTLGSRR
jgi:hypothetical protein